MNANILYIITYDSGVLVMRRYILYSVSADQCKCPYTNITVRKHLHWEAPWLSGIALAYSAEGPRIEISTEPKTFYVTID